MLIRCEQCGRTAKIPVHERVDVQAFERGRLLMFEGNDRSMVRDLAMDGTLAASGRIRLPMAIDAKAREDFAFFVNATAPPSHDATVADRRTVRRRGARGVYTRRAR